MVSVSSMWITRGLAGVVALDPQSPCNSYERSLRLLSRVCGFESPLSKGLLQGRAESQPAQRTVVRTRLKGSIFIARAD